MPEILKKTEESAAFIQSQVKIHSNVGVVLGSGLGIYVDSLDIEKKIPYTDIPHFKTTTVDGHEGFLIVARIKNVQAVIMQGRVHFYEGHSMHEVVHPIRTLHKLGIKKLIQTNAAGGINSNFKVGDLMIIEDHINFMGHNPLRGPNIDALGTRFPDLTEAYSKKLNEIITETGKSLSIKLQKGIYAGCFGPAYETPAEVAMLRTLGADAVGMSTVPETIAAVHMGMHCCAISCISNLAAGISQTKLHHGEVKEAVKLIQANFINLFNTLIPHISKCP